MILALSITLLIFCVSCSAFFSASEASLFSLSSHQLRSFSKSKKRKENLAAKVMQNPSDLLVTLLVMNIFINILLQNVTAEIFPGSLGIIAAIIIPLFLTLFFGEVVPKAISLIKNKSVASFVSPVVYRIVKRIKPVTKFIVKITSVISRFFFFFLKRHQAASKTELLHALQASHEKGQIHDTETQLIEGFLHLGEMTLDKVMAPREDILFFDIRKSLKELERLFSSKQCSKIPVCDGDLDHLLGVLTIDGYFAIRSKVKNAEDIRSYLREPFFVPETLKCSMLLEEPRMKREKMALVVDEYGTCVGLLTDEDLAEIVVGNIFDLREKEKPLYSISSDGVIVTSGRLEIAKLEEILEIKLDLKGIESVTVGGYIIELIGDIPKTGQEVQVKDLLFHVLSASDKRVKRLYIRKSKRLK